MKEDPSRTACLKFYINFNERKSKNIHLDKFFQGKKSIFKEILVFSLQIKKEEKNIEKN